MLAACCAQAAAQSQHGELTVWQASTPGAQGAPADMRWTHDISGKVGEQIDWMIEPELLLRRGQPEDRGVQLRRAFLALRGEDWQLRAGRQLFDWSQTDAVSPADLLNPRDWSDITRVRKLAVPALSARYGSGTSMEAVWLPRQTQSTLPTASWLPAPAAALLARAQETAHGPQWALRAAGNWHQTDWSAVWYRGEQVAPDLRLDAGPRLQPFYRPLRALALTAARQVGEANVVRAEVAHYSESGKGNYLRYVASIDQELSDVANDGDTLYGIVQYAGSSQPGSVFNTLGWPDFQRVLEHSVMFKLNYDAHSDQRTVLEVSGVFNTKGHDSLWQASIQQRIGSATTLTLAGLTMRGGERSFWGGLRSNRRLSLQLSWRY